MMTAAVEEHGAITATIMVIEDFMHYSVRLLREGCMTVLVSPSGLEQVGAFINV